MTLALTVARIAINALTPPRRLPRPFVPSLAERVGGKVVLITGASAGIGRALAERVADAGATVVVVARREDQLNEVVRRIKERGGTAHVIAADLSIVDRIDHVADVVLAQFGAPDVLVNNAGRSIMRTMADAEHRLHDYERLMRVNYLAGVGLTLRFLPGMRARGSGHIVHSSSIGVLGNLPRFSAYVGSKAALDAFLKIAEVEGCADGIRITNVHIPLADTDMASSSDLTSYAKLTLEQVTDMMVDAIRRRPRQLNNPLGSLYALVYSVMSGPLVRVQNRVNWVHPAAEEG